MQAKAPGAQPPRQYTQYGEAVSIAQRRHAPSLNHPGIQRCHTDKRPSRMQSKAPGAQPPGQYTQYGETVSTAQRRPAPA